VTPPRLARWCLCHLLPRADRAAVIGDLDEEFVRHVAETKSALGARVWYWRQVIGSSGHALRLRRARRHVHEVRHQTVAAGLSADVGFALRLAATRPGLIVGITATLAVGIAVTAAALSVAHAVLLRPLPYVNPTALVHVGEADRGETASPADRAGGNLSWPDFQDYRTAQQTFTALAGYSGGSRTLTGFGPPDRIAMAEVTTEFFSVLGVRPQAGRAFTAADGLPGAPPVVMLTDGAWRRRFGGDPTFVGRLLTLNGQPTTVIGILPPDFQFPLRGSAELWLPIRPSPAQVERRFFHWLNVIGRLRPGVTIGQAEADLDSIAAGFREVDPAYHADTIVGLERLGDFVVGDIRRTLLVLLAAAACVLLIACTNVAGLLVARSAARDREMAIRGALGASGWRLRRQVIVESLVLSVPGVLFGLMAGLGLVRMFVTSLPDAQVVSLPHLQGLGLRPGVALMVTALSLSAALVVGLAPAARLTWMASRTRLHGAVGVDRRGARLRTSLVVLQVGLAVVLLCGAGLMTRSVSRLLAVSPGFEPEGLFTARVTLSGSRYADADVVRAVHDDLLTRLARLPGVTGASTIDQLPLTGSGNSGTFVVESQPGVLERETRIRTVAANYFDVMGIPLLEGRPFTETDTAARPRVLLVNETFARTFFDGRALGERVAFPFFDGRPYWEIIGVVGDEQIRQLDLPLLPVAYFPYDQTPDNGFSLAIRTEADPVALEGLVRAVLGEIDGNVPLFAGRTMSSIMESSDAVFRRWTVLTLIGLFSGAALLLTLVGLYGLVSQTVSERTREIGVRVTMGARPGQVVGSVLRGGLTPVLFGIVIGLGVSLVAGRSLEGLLYGISSSDVATLAAVGVAIAIVATLACVVPAGRALRVDPVEALRRE